METLTNIEVKYIYTTSEKLDTLPVVNGQLIVLTNRDAMYYDMNGRHLVTDYSALSNLPKVNGVTLIGNKTTSDLGITAASVGLGNVTNKSEATIKNDFTGAIASGNTGFVKGGDAFNALADKLDTSDYGWDELPDKPFDKVGFGLRTFDPTDPSYGTHDSLSIDQTIINLEGILDINDIARIDEIYDAYEYRGKWFYGEVATNPIFGSLAYSRQKADKSGYEWIVAGGTEMFRNVLYEYNNKLYRYEIGRLIEIGYLSCREVVFIGTLSELRRDYLASQYQRKYAYASTEVGGQLRLYQPSINANQWDWSYISDLTDDVQIVKWGKRFFVPYRTDGSQVTLQELNQVSDIISGSSNVTITKNNGVYTISVSGGGGGGGTIPSTTNLLVGDGSGNAADSQITADELIVALDTIIPHLTTTKAEIVLLGYYGAASTVAQIEAAYPASAHTGEYAYSILMHKLFKSEMNSWTEVVLSSHNLYIYGADEKWFRWDGQSMQEAGYQPTLYSGQNIKTINNQTILGSGDLNVSGLPSYTAQDNGKFLQIVDGQPAWVSIPPAEWAEF